MLQKAYFDYKSGFILLTALNSICNAKIITNAARCAISLKLQPIVRRLPLLFMADGANSASSVAAGSTTTATLAFADIGANLLDDRFIHGIYRGTPRHEPDLDCVLQRAADAGVRRIILTAGTLHESRQALQKARQWNAEYDAIQFGSTVGVHPTRCRQVFEPTTKDLERLDDKGHDVKDADTTFQELLAVAQDGMSDGTVVAIGEIGLDYDRLKFCPQDIQQKYFRRLLKELAKPTHLPLFLHNRSVGRDLYNILFEHRDCWSSGVVHSFDDTLELAQSFIDLHLSIGLNGCSLRTPENLEVAKALPLERILLETDCPYCEVRPSHAGHQYIRTQFAAKAEKKHERGMTVKSRQEPCHVVQVAEIVAGAKSIDVAEVAQATFANTESLFFGAGRK